MTLSFRLLEINPYLSLGSFLHKVLFCLSSVGLMVSKAALPLSVSGVSEQFCPRGWEPLVGFVAAQCAPPPPS